MLHYSSKNYPDLGLLLLRCGIGVMFILHGYPKLMAGPDLWAKLGEAVSVFGIHAIPRVFGFFAAFSECIGGACLIFGIATRFASLMLFFTMLVATTMHLAGGDGINGASHAIESAIIFISIIIIGPGRYSLDALLSNTDD